MTGLLIILGLIVAINVAVYGTKALVSYAVLKKAIKDANKEGKQ